MTSSVPKQVLRQDGWEGAGPPQLCPDWPVNCFGEALDRLRGASMNKRATPRIKTTANSAPDFLPPQFAKLVDRPPTDSGWGHEIKFDGYRLQLHVQHSKAKLLTRRGLDWTSSFFCIARA